MDSSVKHGSGGTGTEVEEVETEFVGQADLETDVSGQADVAESSKPRSCSFDIAIAELSNDHEAQVDQH